MKYLSMILKRLTWGGSETNEDSGSLVSFPGRAKKRKVTSCKSGSHRYAAVKDDAAVELLYANLDGLPRQHPDCQTLLKGSSPAN